MTNCPACGSTDIHRSRSASLRERGRKLFSSERPHRCHACGWRGWGQTTAHHHAAAATSDGWDAIDVDLVQLDGPAAEGGAGFETVPTSSRRARGSGRHRLRHQRSSKSSSRATSSEFNRRVQLVLFVVLLLLGVVVVLRACGGGSRPAEPETGPAARMQNAEVRMEKSGGAANLGRSL